MIDWVSAKIPWPHVPIPSGAMLIVNDEGEVEKAIVRRTVVRGSHCASFTLQSYGSHAEGLAAGLSISGNPSKFLQGHNVFGSDDLMALVSDTVRKLDLILNLGIDQFTYHAIDRGHYEVTCLDINYSFELRSQTDVQAWLRAAEMKMKSRSGRPTNDSGTVYLGKRSRRWSMKFYSKYLEITSGGKDHRLNEAFLFTDIADWSKNKLRAELRLRGMELKELNMTRAKDLQDHIVDLFAQYSDKIDMSGQIPLRDEILSQLPAKVRSTFVLWSSGQIIYDNKSKTGVLSKSTFHRHRKFLLAYGIDISIPCDHEDQSNVVPLVRVLEAVPASIPEWAYSQGLVHKSAHRGNDHD